MSAGRPRRSEWAKSASGNKEIAVRLRGTLPGGLCFWVLRLAFGLQRRMQSHWRSYDANQPKCRAGRSVPSTEATTRASGPRCNRRTARSWNSVIRSTRLPNCAGRADLLAGGIVKRRYLDPWPPQASRCCLPMGGLVQKIVVWRAAVAAGIGNDTPGSRNIAYSMLNLLIFTTFLDE